MILRMTFVAIPMISLGFASHLWIEGENQTSSTTKSHGWYGSVKKETLSGNDWLHHYGNQPGEATYDFKIGETGNYTFWARLNTVASKPSWKLDKGNWKPVPLNGARGQQNIASDGSIDHRFIAWVKIGDLDLKSGDHQISFHWEGGAQNSGGLDCFILTTDPFVPQGARKPGIQKPAGPADWFPLIADEDSFSPKSVIDMSSLVPAPAGKDGVLKSELGKLRFAKNKHNTKLWGVGANIQPGKYTRKQLTQRARYLRKFGVNIVRQHAVFDELHTNGKIDPAKLNQYDWWFAELKKNGIYSDWSVFYHWKIRRDSGYELFDDLPGNGDLRDTYGVITAAPELTRLRNKVLVELLNHKNPYTGLRYADDPALAIVEMQNEDSIFFWNPLSDLAAPNPKKWQAHAKQLRQMFATWVKKKYSSDAELRKAWGRLKHGDSVKADELRVMSPWELTGEGPRGAFAGQTQRAADCIRFLAELQRSQFETMEKAIRLTGYKAVIMTTAWQVGGAATEAANLWTDSVGTMIDRHNYSGGGAGGHGIAEGKVKNSCHLGNPGGGIFSIGMKQVESLPFCVTEWTQSAPNQWKIESAPIMAFYGLGLQGWDASFHFIQSGTRLGDGWPRMSSYASGTPAYFGQFPALAFALKNEHLTESSIVAARRLSSSDVFSGKDALKQDATKGEYDAKTMIVDGGTPLEAFAIGRVTVDFKGGKTEQADFSKFWDTSRKIIRSKTGELTWNYGKKVITVETDKTQAVIGKTGNGTFQLPSVTLSFKTPFVSTILTPLDNKPLAKSERILITALARDKQTGTEYNADGTVLEKTGTAPLLLEPVQATIKLAGPKPMKVTPCDHYGYPLKSTVPIKMDGSFQIDGRYRAYYYEIRR